MLRSNALKSFFQARFKPSQKLHTWVYGFMWGAIDYGSATATSLSGFAFAEEDTFDPSLFSWSFGSDGDMLLTDQLEPTSTTAGYEYYSSDPASPVTITFSYDSLPLGRLISSERKSTNTDIYAIDPTHRNHMTSLLPMTGTQHNTDGTQPLPTTHTDGSAASTDYQHNTGSHGTKHNTGDSAQYRRDEHRRDAAQYRRTPSQYNRLLVAHQ